MHNPVELVSGTGFVAKKERETKMTMEVSGVGSEKKTMLDVLVDMALVKFQNEQMSDARVEKI